MFGIFKKREPTTYTVRIGHRAAVQDLRRAMDLAETAIEDHPWDDDLKAIKTLLDDVWGGLTFGSK